MMTHFLPRRLRLVLLLALLGLLASGDPADPVLDSTTP